MKLVQRLILTCLIVVSGAAQVKAQYPGYNVMNYGGGAAAGYAPNHCPLAQRTQPTPNYAQMPYSVGYAVQPMAAQPMYAPQTQGIAPYYGGGMGHGVAGWNQPAYPPQANWHHHHSATRSHRDHPWHLGHYLLGN